MGYILNVLSFLIRINIMNKLNLLVVPDNIKPSEIKLGEKIINQ